MRRGLPLLIALSIAFAGCPCKAPPVGPAIGAVIDCLSQDKTRIDAVTAELQPLLALESPNWEMFEAKAKAAGINIGGCVAAELINRYLAPAPGNAAPAPEAGEAARATMERLRASFGGATFKTAQGTL